MSKNFSLKLFKFFYGANPRFWFLMVPLWAFTPTLWGYPLDLGLAQFKAEQLARDSVALVLGHENSPSQSVCSYLYHLRFYKVVEFRFSSSVGLGPVPWQRVVAPSSTLTPGFAQTLEAEIKDHAPSVIIVDDNLKGGLDSIKTAFPILGAMSQKIPLYFLRRNGPEGAHRDGVLIWDGTLLNVLNPQNPASYQFWLQPSKGGAGQTGIQVSENMSVAKAMEAFRLSAAKTPFLNPIDSETYLKHLNDLHSKMDHINRQMAKWGVSNSSMNWKLNKEALLGDLIALHSRISVVLVDADIKVDYRDPIKLRLQVANFGSTVVTDLEISPVLPKMWSYQSISGRDILNKLNSGTVKVVMVPLNMESNVLGRPPASTVQVPIQVNLQIKVPGMSLMPFCVFLRSNITLSN